MLAHIVTTELLIKLSSKNVCWTFPNISDGPQYPTYSEDFLGDQGHICLPKWQLQTISFKIT